jgi:arginyl-tRNA synthetase
VPFPPNAYQGDYVREMAEQIKQAHGDRYVHPADVPWRACRARDRRHRGPHLDALILAGKDLLGEDYAYVHGHVLSEQLADCRADLEEFGVHFDVWFSERSLYDTGMVARAVEKLEKPATSIPRTAPSGSAPPPSATRRTASCSARTASTPISPPTSPTT